MLFLCDTKDFFLLVQGRHSSGSIWFRLVLLVFPIDFDHYSYRCDFFFLSIGNWARLSFRHLSKQTTKSSCGVFFKTAFWLSMLNTLRFKNKCSVWETFFFFRKCHHATYLCLSVHQLSGLWKIRYALQRKDKFPGKHY